LTARIGITIGAVSIVLPCAGLISITR